MRLALWIGAVVMIAAGVILSLTSLALAGTGRQVDPLPPSGKTMVGVYVDNRDGNTESTIDCRKDGYHQTVNGDATLFMPNLEPHRVVCVITIRPVEGSV